MRWIAVGQEAEGVIAIGQFATGVFAIGQVATGVIAVGQVARGFVAIGQGAIGVFAVGMGSVGLVGSMGMLGVGGRGLGIILPLVPSLGPKRALPATIPAARLLEGDATHGYVTATLDAGGGRPTLTAEGRAIEVRFDSRLRAAIEAQAGALPVYAHLSRTPAGWICDELLAVPRARWRSPGWWAWWAVQLAGLAVACLAFWALAGIPVIQALLGPRGILVSR